MSHDPSRKTKPTNRKKKPTNVESQSYDGKYFAFSVLLAGLAALYYWYNYLGAPYLVESPLFTVMDIEGKGKGLIAERDIKQGELVLKEKPLFVVPKSVETSSPAALIYNLLQGLSQRDQHRFLNLSYVLPGGVDDEQIALAIFQTNAVAAGTGVGIFPTMARLNHACSSAFNVVYNWREEEKCLVVHALKDIRKGEELLTTYMDTKRPRHERRTILSQKYGFHCSCHVCSLPDELSNASNDRLSEISRLYQEFSKWGNYEVDGPLAIDYIRQIWRLEDEEGYISERGQLAADAALIAASHSDEESAREWANLARKWFSYEVGADSRHATNMELIAAHPEDHGSWGTRIKLHVGGPNRQ